MLRIFLVLGLTVGAALARGADASLADARRAQAELGPAIWSEVIRIENAAPAGRYPRTLHALVFELAGLLWFYTDVDGTQSLSLRRGRLAEEKSDLSPLLRAIEPGFARWSVVPGPAAKQGGDGGLPNGCFIESVGALRRRLEQGAELASPRLLSYYYGEGGQGRGHTVLTYTTPTGLEVVDPAEPARPQSLPVALAVDALQLARALAGPAVVKARWLPLAIASLGEFFARGGSLRAGDAGDVATLTR